MAHIDPDDLALIALADTQAAPAERHHLGSCATCAAELLTFRHTVDVGRSAAAVELLVPASAPWARIHAELGLSDAVAAVPTLADFEDGGPVSERPHTGSAASQRPADGPMRPPAPIVALPRARRRWIAFAAAAAVLGLVAGYAASSWLPVPATGTGTSVLARAELEALPGWNETGQASVEASSAGQRDVLITLASVDAGSPDAPLREVWLLSQDATKLVSLGLLSGTSGRFVIPADIDLADYPLVDVSAEPNDGNPAHSSNSVVRGELRSS